MSGRAVRRVALGSVVGRSAFWHVEPAALTRRPRITHRARPSFSTLPPVTEESHFLLMRLIDAALDLRLARVDPVSLARSSYMVNAPREAGGTAC
jgi:hypothetical protein